MENFWINDPYILFKNYNIIFPKSDMTRIETMNSVTRFVIFFIIIVIMFEYDETFVYIGIIIIIMIISFYYIDFNKNEKVYIENYKNYENYEDINEYEKYKINEDKKKIDVIDKSSLKNYNDIVNQNKNDNIISGYINSDKNYVIGKNNLYYDSNEINKKKKKRKFHGN